MAGVTGEVDFFDRIAVPVDFAVDHRIKRRLLGQGPEAISYQDLLAHLLAAYFPIFPGLWRLEEEILVFQGPDLDRSDRQFSWRFG